MKSNKISDDESNEIANLVTGETESLGLRGCPSCRTERYSLGPKHCAPVGKYFEPVDKYYKDVEGLIEGGYFGKDNKDEFKRIFGPKRALFVREILEKHKDTALPVH